MPGLWETLSKIMLTTGNICRGQTDSQNGGAYGSDLWIASPAEEEPRNSLAQTLQIK